MRQIHKAQALAFFAKALRETGSVNGVVLSCDQGGRKAFEGPLRASEAFDDGEIAEWLEAQALRRARLPSKGMGAIERLGDDFLPSETVVVFKDERSKEELFGLDVLGIEKAMIQANGLLIIPKMRSNSNGTVSIEEDGSYAMEISFRGEKLTPERYESALRELERSVQPVARKAPKP